MKKEWQDVLDRFLYGIYLITVSSSAGINGMIASWVTQCSHEPPLVALAIRKNRLSHELIRQSETFCINVLPKESIAIIKHFKIPDWKKKFEAITYFPSQNGLPVLDDCIGYLDCSLEKAIDAGDHTLFIGRISAGALVRGEISATLSTMDYNGVYRGSQ